MQIVQQAKYVSAVAPAAIVDDAAITGIAIDTKGCGYCEVILELGATDIAMTVLKLEESDDNSTWVDVTGATFDGGKNTDGGTLALPSATDDGQTIVFQVNCGAGLRRRYLRVAGTFGNGTVGGYMSGSARLSQLAITPSVDADLADGGVCRV